MTPHPDNQQSIRLYRARAAGYDRSARATMALRARTIALLGLRPGDVVIDVGCGTGLSYPPLVAAVAPGGRVFGVEQSAEMFAQAQARVVEHGWTQVWHRNEPAETVEFPERADAILFNYVHDISRTDAAVDNLMRQVRPGGRVAVAGMKFFPWWTGPLNLLAWMKNRPYNAKAADLWRPWDRIERWCTGFERRSTQAGMGYIAHGIRKEDPR